MLFSEMVQEAKNYIQDSTFDGSVAGYVNEAFLQASGRINVPDLKRLGYATTVTGQMFCSMAGIQDGFSGRLSKIINKDIARYRSVEDLVSWVIDSNRLLDEAGTVEAVALEGKTLWYFPTPAIEENVQCIMFSNPVVMEDDEDMPLAFPEQCHRNIGVHGAAFFAYSIIEDGIEGDKVNTNFHLQMFEKGIIQLMEWIGKNKTHMVTSVLNDDVLSTTTYGRNFLGWNNVK